MKKTFQAITAAALLSCSLFAADAPGLNPISSIDWDFFGSNIEIKFKSCACDAQSTGTVQKAGFEASLIEPIAMIDVTDTPWRFPTFDIDGSDDPLRRQGTGMSPSDEISTNNGFRYVHYIAYPIMSFLDFVQDMMCFERLNVLSMMFQGEIQPQYNNDVIASFTQPMKLLFSNPVAQLACAVDCAAASFGEPMDIMPWCAGCWGPMATDTGYTIAKEPVTEAALLATRMVDLMHYDLTLTKTSNSGLVFGLGSEVLRDSMCDEKYYPQIIKKQYFLQLAYPTVWSAQPIGKIGLTWANFKNRPYTQNDFVYVLWRKRDFCSGAYKCTGTFTSL